MTQEYVDSWVEREKKKKSFSSTLNEDEDLFCSFFFSFFICYFDSLYFSVAIKRELFHLVCLIQKSTNQIQTVCTCHCKVINIFVYPCRWILMHRPIIHQIDCKCTEWTVSELLPQAHLTNDDDVCKKQQTILVASPLCFFSFLSSSRLYASSQTANCKLKSNLSNLLIACDSLSLSLLCKHLMATFL